MGRTLLRNGTHLLALCGFAIAKPLYDFLETDPSALVVDDVTGGALVVMALMLLLLPPLLLLGVEALAACAGERGLEITHLVFVGGLVALFVVGALPGLAPLAVAAGAFAAWAYRRAEPVRTYLTVLAVAPVLFVGLFLFSGEASPLVTDVGAPEPAPAAAGVTAPVVMVVFDELPLSSLLDRKGDIDRARFPNFARFAERSTWFRNTVSIEAFTPWAVPVILDGRRASPRGYSHPAFHPNSLFTLLRRTHDLHVREAYTRVCPEALCPRGEGSFLVRGIRGFDGLVPSLWDRLLPDRPAELATDATQALRRMLGARTRATRPGDTAQLAEIRAVLDARVPSFEAFLRELAPGERPGLHYQHAMFPHAPFDFQREGPYQLGDRRLRDDHWDGDRSLVRLGLRRHLLQLEYTDRLLGEMIDRLESSGLYDRAAVVLVADHGATFMPDTRRRSPTPGTLPFLAPVPFLLKAPGQTEGEVDDTPAETVDVLPTLAEAIGVRVPWRVDGRSLLGAGAGTGRDRVAMSNRGRPGPELPRAALAFGLPALRARLPVSGDGKDRRPLFAEMGFAQLVGAPLPGGRPAEVRLEETKAPRLALQGTLVGLEGRPVVAIGRCGRVAGVARAYRQGEALRFAAVLDPSVPGGCPPEVRVIE